MAYYTIKGHGSNQHYNLSIYRNNHRKIKQSALETFIIITKFNLLYQWEVKKINVQLHIPTVRKITKWRISL